MRYYIDMIWLGLFAALFVMCYGWGDTPGMIVSFFLGLTPVLIYHWGVKVWRETGPRFLIGRWEVTSNEEAWILHGLDVEAEIAQSLQDEIERELQKSGGGMTWSQFCEQERQEGVS